MTTASTLVALATSVMGAELPVRIRAWDGSVAGSTDASAPTLVIHSRRALRRIVWRPDELGLARAYVTGEIDVDGDLEHGLRRVWAFARERESRPMRLGWRERLAALNAAVRLGAIGLPPSPPATEARPAQVRRGRLHSRRRDRAVIAHHYDLSNEFYALVLDETMAYSCAYFASDDPAASLADAQRAKLDLVCRRLELTEGSRLLDIGCGWGSLSVHAAREHGAQVLGITLSAQQRDFVAKRVADAGLQHLVEVRLLDYRDLPRLGEYDAVASIEMGEHVGAQQYPIYLECCFTSLRPGGRLLIQQMSRRPGVPGGGPFIEAFIAPDMHMQPVGETVAAIERAGFEVRGVQAMREHYARTGRAWLATLEDRWCEVVALVGEEVARVWRLYLVGGALAFEEGRMGVDQIAAVKPPLEAARAHT